MKLMIQANTRESKYNYVPFEYESIGKLRKLIKSRRKDIETINSDTSDLISKLSQYTHNDSDRPLVDAIKNNWVIVGQLRIIYSQGYSFELISDLEPNILTVSKWFELCKWEVE